MEHVVDHVSFAHAPARVLAGAVTASIQSKLRPRDLKQMRR